MPEQPPPALMHLRYASLRAWLAADPRLAPPVRLQQLHLFPADFDSLTGRLAAPTGAATWHRPSTHELPSGHAQSTNAPGQPADTRPHDSPMQASSGPTGSQPSGWSAPTSGLGRGVDDAQEIARARPRPTSSGLDMGGPYHEMASPFRGDAPSTRPNRCPAQLG